jgi:signal transduction histidine kinase
MWGRKPRGWPGSVRRSVAQIRWWDIVLAAGTAAFSVVDTALDATLGGRTVTLAGVETAAAALLTARRVHPLVALSGALGLLGTAELVLGHYQTWASVLIALVAVYSAAAYATNLPYTLAVVAAFAVTLGVGEPAGQAAGNVLWTVIALSLPLAVGLTARRFRTREAEAQQRAAHLEAERAQQVAEASAVERQRIARELHDIVSHSLGVMVLQAGAAEQAFDRAPQKARQAVRTIRATGLEAIDEMSRLVGLLRDDTQATTAPQPTLADLERLLAAVRSGGVDVGLHTEGVVRALPAAIELNAYRVVQEGLTNVVKHNCAGTATVTVAYQPDCLTVEVSDEGTATANGPGGGFGLAGLRERVAVFGGRLDYGPRSAGGWAVRACFPVPVAEPRS